MPSYLQDEIMVRLPPSRQCGGSALDRPDHVAFFLATFLSRSGAMLHACVGMIGLANSDPCREAPETVSLVQYPGRCPLSHILAFRFPTHGLLLRFGLC